MYFTENDQKDHGWWIQYMFLLGKVSIYDVVATNPSTMIDLWTDGATNGSRQKGWAPGIGAYFQGQWISSKVPSFLLDKYQKPEASYSKQTHIDHFECLAIVAALYSFQDQFKPRDYIHIRCDNRKCEAILADKNTDDAFMMDCVRWITMFAIKKHIWFYISYIRSKDNISDPLSRYHIPDFIDAMQQSHLP